MKFFYYILQLQLFSNNNILVGRFFQTLGIKINVYLNNKLCNFNQSNINGNIITNCKFYRNFQDKNIFELYKLQNASNLFKNVKIINFSPSEIKFQETTNINSNNKKKTNNFSTINLYGFLKIINELKIFNSYKPDYYRISMEEQEETPTRKFYELYYRLSGFNKKYTENAYINDSRIHTMNSILGMFGSPLFIFYSGDGQETFLYFGVHECNKKRIMGFILIQFDLYGKVMKYFHHIPLCDKCHKQYTFKENLIIENKDIY